MGSKALIAVIVAVVVVAGAGGGYILLKDNFTDDVTYSLDGGVNDADNRAKYDGKDIELKDPTKPHYNFAGWYKDKDFKNKVTSVGPNDGKITLYAKWTPIVYQITYHNMEGVASNPNPSTCTIEDTIELKPVSKTGYSFNGWATNPELTEKITEITDAKSNIDLYPIFQTVSYSVTYNTYGATENDNPAKITIVDTVTLKAPVRAGYSFNGWFSADDFKPESQVTVLSGISENVVLYAKWTPIVYQITYHNMEGVASNPNPLTCTIEDTIELQPVSKTGYSFNGWAVNQELTEKITVISGTKSDIDLYPIFQIISYSVTYNTYGATENDNPAKITIVDIITLKTPVRAGYSFLGWFFADDFKPESQVTVLSGISENVVLYAKWTPVIYTVSYVDGGSEVNLNEKACTCEDTLVLVDPLKFNYSFKGWYKDPAFTSKSKVTTLEQVYEDITLYAKFEELSGSSYIYNQLGTYESYGVTYEVGGSIKINFSNYIDDSMLYSIRNAMNYIYNDKTTSNFTYNSAVFEFEKGKSFMIGDSEFIGMEYIDTIDGKVMAFKITSEYGTAYYGSNGIAYYGVLAGKGANIEMILQSKGTFDVKEQYTLKVDHSSALKSATSGGVYAAGTEIILTCTLNTGGVFKYWIPQDLKGEFTYSRVTIEAMSEDLDLFAWCERDNYYEATSTYTKYEWTVKNGYDNTTVFTSNEKSVLVNVPVGGYYITELKAKRYLNTYTFTYHASGGGTKTVTFNWLYNSTKYSLDWTADVDTYVDYRMKELDSRSQSTDNDENKRFVEYQSQYITDLAAAIGSKVSGLTELQFATYVLCFTQNAFEYEFDSDYNGQAEYWKYPYETLVDVRGDCEDTSILHCTLMAAYGNKVALLLYTGIEYIGKGHCAAGIEVAGASGKYYEVGDTKYFYCETTGDNWAVGKIPEGYSTVTNLVAVN